MKKNKIIIGLLALAISATSGCKQYLDLPPKNQRTVTTTTDMKSLMAGYLRSIAELRVRNQYDRLMPLAPIEATLMFEAYSDNIDMETALTACYLKPNNIHMSQEKRYADLLLWNDMATPTAIWTQHYELIGFFNALIDQMNDEIKDATNEQRDQLLGELYTNRAYYFFKLLQYFAPYQKAELGIPVYLHSGKAVLGVDMSRKSHAEVYKTILEDLGKAEAMLNRTQPLTGFNVLYNQRFLHHLMAQVYWFKAESPAKESGDYEQVKKHASIAIEGVEANIPRTGIAMKEAWSGRQPNYPAVNMETLSQGANSAIYGSCFAYLGINPADVPLKEDFCSLFAAGDIRSQIYFNQDPSRAGGKVGPAGRIIAQGWPADNSNDGNLKRGNTCLFKPEEAYLMLAEAQYRTSQTAEAISTLNKFKSFRNAGTADGLSGNALLQEIMHERRKEFFGDSDKRWIDLKRFGGININRKLRFFNKNYDLTASSNDYHYALPIPLTELQQNKNMIPNEGWIAIEY